MTLSPQPAAKRPKKERALLESIPTPSVTGTSKFTRALGSADPLTRKKAVTALQRWLELRNEVAAADLIVIWKGLFYCYWHSDLVPVQVNAQNISLHPAHAITFYLNRRSLPPNLPASCSMSSQRYAQYLVAAAVFVHTNQHPGRLCILLNMHGNAAPRVVWH